MARAMTALIVDYDKKSTDELTTILAEANMDACIAINANEARTQLASGTVFSLLLVEMNLPYESGTNFISDLRQNSKKKLPPIVMLTAKSIDKLIKEKLLASLGITLCLEKPIDKRALLEFISSKVSAPAPKKIYDANVINAFLNATLEAIKGYIQDAPAREKPFIKEFSDTYGEFSGVIQFKSTVIQGVVALSFSKKCIWEMANTVYGGQMELTDPILLDFAGELCNQTAGRAQAIFEGFGYRFEISTPTLVMGANHRIVHRFNAPCLVLPFCWKDTKFFTEFILDCTEPLALASKQDANGLKSGDANFLNK